MPIQSNYINIYKSITLKFWHAYCKAYYTNKLKTKNKIMKNLFERMTAENKNRFEDAIKMFPATCNELKKDLQNNYFVINLEFRTVLDFSNMVLQQSFDVSEIFNSFENL